MFHDKIYTANKYSSNISCLLEFYWQKKDFMITWILLDKKKQEESSAILSSLKTRVKNASKTKFAFHHYSTITASIKGSK